MAQRCWNTRLPSICVSFKVTGELGLSCWAGTASGNANSKKISAPLLIRALGARAVLSARRNRVRALLGARENRVQAVPAARLIYDSSINANSFSSYKGPRQVNCDESSHTHRAISILMFYINTTRTGLLATSWYAVALIYELRQTSLWPSAILRELCVELFGFHHRGH